MNSDATGSKVLAAEQEGAKSDLPSGLLTGRGSPFYSVRGQDADILKKLPL